MKDITRLGADEQTFPLVKDCGTTQITVKDYFEKKKQGPLK